MSDLLDILLAKSGKTRADLVTGSSRTSRVFRSKGVSDGSDIDHALSLPRRDWRETEDIEDLIDQMTDYLRTPDGQWRLLPIQAVTLLELHDFGGCFAPIVVGGGKTLISLLAPRIMKAKRAVLIVPAKLRDKTVEEMKEYRQNWILKPFVIQSYETLSLDAHSDYLQKLDPDLIMFDEVHHVSNEDAAVTRKVSRFMETKPDVPVLAMSGTITKRSILDYAHILQWTHKNKHPVPTEYHRAKEWSYALDEKVAHNSRMSPGALSRLIDGKIVDNVDIHDLRKAYRLRLTETPGVVASNDPPLGVSLTIREIPFEAPKIMVKHFEQLREFWETPDGHPCMDGKEIWSHAREMVCGFYYVWDPRPPNTEFPITDKYGNTSAITWLQARRQWSQYVRYVLKHNRSDIDSEVQVRNAVISGEIGPMKGFETPFEALEIWQAWERIAPSFKPKTRAVWFDDTMLFLAKEWLDQGGDRICWFEHTAFGHKLSKLTGYPVYGRKGLDLDGRSIMRASGPIIASIGSNGTGWNLQRFTQNLVVSMPPTGVSWEQLLGRPHRQGQDKDVSFSLVLPCIEQLAAFYQSIRDARYVTESIGQVQKLTYGDIKISSEWEAENRDGPLWNKSN